MYLAGDLFLMIVEKKGTIFMVVVGIVLLGGRFWCAIVIWCAIEFKVLLFELMIVKGINEQYKLYWLVEDVRDDPLDYYVSLPAYRKSYSKLVERITSVLT